MSVDGLRRHDGGDGIVEMQLRLSREPGDGLGQGLGGQRPRGDDGGGLRVRGLNFLPDDFDKRLGCKDPGDIGGELPPVHRQGLARRHPGSKGCGHNQGIKPPHLLLEQTHGALAAVGPQRVAAHQLPQERRLVGRRELLGLHLIETDPDAPAGRLPGRLTPRQPPADDYGDYRVLGSGFWVLGGH